VTDSVTITIAAMRHRIAIASRRSRTPVGELDAEVVAVYNAITVQVGKRG
jgi:hypothetical protein